MKKMKSKLHLTTIIVSIVSIVLNVCLVIGLLTNVFGFKDMYAKFLQSMADYAIDIDSEIAFACFDTGLTIITHLIFAILFIRLYRRNSPSVQLGRAITNIAFWYLFLTFSLASVFALIAGSKMTKTYSRPIIAEATPRENPNTEDVNEYKMKAMTEAVARLKELRQSGAISDEEYYATLDKILEG